MTATIIDGTALAATMRQRLAERLRRLKDAHAIVPGLAVVQVGDNPASQIYVRNKLRAAEQVGMRSIEHKLAADVSAAELLRRLAALNADDGVDGILVQLPLPPQIEPDQVVDAIHPDKDVDGLHTANVARLARGRPGLVPCTPMACTLLLRSVRPNPTGDHAVIIGRSQLVGRPLAHLLLQADCTVTVAHSKSRDLPELCRSAAILVATAGRPELVRGDWIKPGAIVIDVGIHRQVDAAGKPHLVGDVATAEAAARAAAITPVPGGVGPMTVACLLENGFSAACRRRGLDPAAI